MVSQYIKSHLTGLLIVTVLVMSPAIWAEEYQSARHDISAEKAVMKITDVQHIEGHFDDHPVTIDQIVEDGVQAIAMRWDAAFEDEQAIMVDFEAMLQHSLSAYYACAVDEVHMFVDVDTQDGEERAALARYIVVYEPCSP